MRRVFKTRAFNRWLRKSELVDQDLCDELRILQETAKGLLGLQVAEITIALARGGLLEICHGN